jgi:hypothetical protein
VEDVEIWVVDTPDGASEVIAAEINDASEVEEVAYPEAVLDEIDSTEL